MPIVRGDSLSHSFVNDSGGALRSVAAARRYGVYKKVPSRKL